MMARRSRIAAVVAAGLMLSGCYGPFELTRKVWNWNGQVSDNKWVVEGVFLLCSILPVYYFAGAADAIILNSVVFWTGKSMLDDSTASAPTQRIVRGDEETVLTRVSDDELLIEQFRAGTPAGSVRLQRKDDGVVALGADGNAMLRSSTRLDGSVVVADAQGHTVASYTSGEADRLAESIQ